MDDASLFWWLYAPFGAAVTLAGVAAAFSPGWAVRGAVLLVVGGTNLALAGRGAYRNFRQGGYEPGIPAGLAFLATLVAMVTFALTPV